MSTRSSAGLMLDFVDLVQLGQDRHRAGGGVDAPLRLGRRHALHAVGAGFELEPRERALAGDAADDFLVAAVLAGALAEHLDVPALATRRSARTCEQVAGEDRRLVAAGAGADFEEDVVLVARIARQQQLAQLAFLRPRGAPRAARPPPRRGCACRRRRRSAAPAPPPGRAPDRGSAGCAPPAAAGAQYSMDRSRNCCEPPAISALASSRPTSSKRSAIFCRRWRMDSFMMSRRRAFGLAADLGRGILRDVCTL